MINDDIASSVGYEDPTFFRCLFKRLAGTTPARYHSGDKPALRIEAQPEQEGSENVKLQHESHNEGRTCRETEPRPEAAVEQVG